MLALFHKFQNIARTISIAVSSPARQQQAGSALSDAGTSTQNSNPRSASPSLSGSSSTLLEAPTTSRSPSPPPSRCSQSAPPVLSRSSTYLKKEAFDELLVKLNSTETILEALETINRKDLTFTTTQVEKLNSTLKKLHTQLENRKQDLNHESTKLNKKLEAIKENLSKSDKSLKITKEELSNLKRNISELETRSSLKRSEQKSLRDLKANALTTTNIHDAKQATENDNYKREQRVNRQIEQTRQDIDTLKKAKALIQKIDTSQLKTLTKVQSLEIVKGTFDSLRKDLDTPKPNYERIIDTLKKLKTEFAEELTRDPESNKIFDEFTTELSTKLSNSRANLGIIKGQIEEEMSNLRKSNFYTESLNKRKASHNPSVAEGAKLESDSMEPILKKIEGLNSKLIKNDQKMSNLGEFQKQVTQLIDSTKLKKSSVSSFRSLSPSPSQSPSPSPSRSPSRSSSPSPSPSVISTTPVPQYSPEVKSLLEAINAKLDDVGFLNQIVKIFSSEQQNKDIFEQYRILSVPHRKQVLDAIERQLDDITSSDLDSSARKTELEVLLEDLKKDQTPSLTQIYELIATNTSSWSWVLPKSTLSDNELQEVLRTFRSESREGQINTLKHLLERSETKQIAYQILNKLPPSRISDICNGLDPNKDSPELLLVVAKHLSFEKTKDTLTLPVANKLLKIVEHLIEKEVDIKTFQPLAAKIKQKLEELHKSQKPLEFRYVNLPENLRSAVD